MEGDGKLESAFWNPFFNYKKSSASAYMNLRLRLQVACYCFLFYVFGWNDLIPGKASQTSLH